MFLAMPGLTVDGRHFIQQALDRGASHVYYEQQGSDQFTLPQTNVPLIPIENLMQKQGVLAAEFYAHPSRHLNTIGITGTNGKTSVSYFIAQCLDNTAVLGTTGYGTLEHIQKLSYTTPMAPQLQEILKELRDSAVKCVAMEVSSHALAMHRVAGIEFDIAVFTNLSQDHLDFHKTMQDYAAAKKMLFDWPTLKYAVVNSDDAVGEEIVQGGHAYPILTYGIYHQADIYAENIRPLPEGFSFVLHTPWGKANCVVPLLGEFNIANCLAVVGVLGIMGLTLDDIVQKISQLKPPPGRMQLYRAKGMPCIAIDFAHTPDALEKALVSLRRHCPGKLYVVFGCGGDRDTAKRAVMGKVASIVADYVLVTNDNPRHEAPQQIADMICAGIDKDKLLEVQLDRGLAIKRALAQATAQDLVLIAGKGHEAYQIVGDKMLPFSDSAVVMEQLKSADKNEE